MTVSKATRRLKITPEQLKKIWAKAREIGVSEDRLRDTVERISGRRSIKALTKKQAVRVIDSLQAQDPAIIDLATPRQETLIERLKIDAEWTDDHLMNFVFKKFMRGRINEIRRSEAGVVIRVLNAAMRKKREVA